MTYSLTQFNSFMESLPQFIDEMGADWEMVVDYVFAQYKQPTMTEWALIGRLFDQVVDS